MRMNLILGITVGLGALAAVVGGCSSAPPRETSDESKDGLNLGGGGLAIDYCANLPALKTSVATVQIGGYTGDMIVRDCYQHVQGYEVAVPARVTWCPGLYMPGVGWWFDQDGYPGASYDAAVPAWSGTAGNHVCHYTFRDCYDLSWHTPYALGTDQATEQTLAAQLCTALSGASVPYTGVRYILPYEIGFVPGAPSNDTLTGPYGEPLPDLGNSFGQSYCGPTLYGYHGCGSCIQQ